jgi:predicted P-loop ATPase
MDDFTAQLQVNDRQHILPTTNNAHILVSHEIITSTLRFNEFSNTVELAGVPLKDSDIFYIRAELDRLYRVSFPKELIFDASIAVAEKHRYHPVRDYLSALQWDGVPRLSSLFGAYFITPERKPLYEAASRCFGIGAVARVYQPGAKLDTYPVLEGKQGIFKSSGIAALVPDKAWFSDTRIDLGSKDAYISLNGKWIYEVAELDSFKGWGSTRLKSFVSSASDSYRPPYGRLLQTIPRQTVFVATTNDSDYVSDSTGERRKWPVPVNSVDIDALHRDRDALWAEAVVAYRAREQWYLDDEMAAEMAEVAQEKQEADPLDERIYDDVMHKLLTMADVPGTDLSYLSVGQIYETIQSDSTKAGPHERRRISDSLRRLGFKVGAKRRVQGKPANVWLVPDHMRAQAEAKRAAAGGIASVGTA